jgi:transketolase
MLATSNLAAGPDIMALKELCKQLRLDVLDVTAGPGGHVSSCFSAVEIMAAIYFGGILRYRPGEPEWPDRDRFLLSKGHAAPLYYPVLARAGYAPIERLKSFRTLDDGLHGHPIQGAFPGVESTSGSLGQGLSIGLGHVLAGRLSGHNYRVYVLLGDGECEEGQIWEAAMAAAHWKTDNLIAIIDHNKYQQTGPISREMSLSPFADKWRSFGWYADDVDGHDAGAIINKLTELQQVKGRPSVLIAHTVKGKGVGLIEKDYSFHGRSLSAVQDAQAREEIRCQ